MTNPKFADRDGAYDPIREYALIGDCHGSALVSRHASVDWCCLGRFDSNPVFCRILDADKGGYFSITPEEDYESEHMYIENTNLLRTTFRTARGRLDVVDFMPVGRDPGASTHDYVTLNSPHWLVRIAACQEGAVPVRMRYRPTIEFARRPAVLHTNSASVHVDGGPHLYANAAFTIERDVAVAETTLAAGEVLPVVVSLRSIDPPSAELVFQLRNITRAFWKEWARYCRYNGPYRTEILRSALTLKLLTYAPTGALVAAPTTSLPEAVGGERNWDYRYCWVRDASFTLFALSALGYTGEARDFDEYLTEYCKLQANELQVVYGIQCETQLDERILDHLGGYRNSRPVRIGNAAYQQHQLDIYGELMDWALLYRYVGGSIGDDDARYFRGLADVVCDHWREPGQGMWEMRSEPRHHVYGRIMCWVAVDRAIRLFGENSRWVKTRELILSTILRDGLDPGTGSLRQSLQHAGMDAALLLAPQVGLPIDDQTLRATIRAIESELRSGDYVRRYITDDGLPGHEGAFFICSFWLVQAKLHIGEVEEARRLFERLLACGNEIGLFSEEIDIGTHEFLGNFPQAFTHLALILCAIDFELFDAGGLKALEGTHADRARWRAEKSEGWRAAWSVLKKTIRTLRVRSSRDSILPRTICSG